MIDLHVPHPQKPPVSSNRVMGKDEDLIRGRGGEGAIFWKNLPVTLH